MLGLGDLPNDNKRRSVNSETLLPGAGSLKEGQDLNSGLRAPQCWGRNSSRSRRYKMLIDRRVQTTLAWKPWVRTAGREC